MKCSTKERLDLRYANQTLNQTRLSYCFSTLLTSEKGVLEE